MTSRLHMQSRKEHLPVSVKGIPKILRKIREYKEKALAVLVAPDKDNSYPETIIDRGNDLVDEEISTKQTLSDVSVYNERRNTEFQEWDEVPRAKEIISVGDLHGSKRAFELNLQKAEVIDSKGVWIGGDRDVVFHGDILADRNADGFNILERIHTLRVRAKNAGGNISVLAGNHEDWAFAYLTGQSLPYDGEWTAVNGYIGGPQAHGIREFKKFGDTSQEILMKMRKNLQGLRILEEMCSMKLAEHIDDTLFVHVVPNEVMLSQIVSMGVDMINDIYQKGMRFHLLGEGVEPILFHSLRLSFLDTESRTLDAKQTTYDALRDKRVNHIIHGHDKHNAGASLDKHGMKITGNDFGFEHAPGAQPDTPSFIRIETNGNFKYGNGLSMNRETQKKVA